MGIAPDFLQESLEKKPIIRSEMIMANNVGGVRTNMEKPAGPTSRNRALSSGTVNAAKDTAISSGPTDNNSIGRSIAATFSSAKRGDKF